MNINQHNYEEFFLLYIDGELSAADKQTVEQFVQGNPGLADELDNLLQMRLPDDAAVFDGKALLYRNGSTGINLENYEENFLLYVDNELDTVSKARVETFVLQHPTLQEDFTLLKQTRLTPEAIYFSGKQSLYRKEEKERPVFFLGWQRIAVAAAFIGLAVLIWTVFPGNDANQQLSIARQEPAASKPSDQRTEKKSAGNTNEISGGASTQPVASNKVARSLPVIHKNNNRQKNIPVQHITPVNLIALNDIQPPTVSLEKENTVTEKTAIAETTRAKQALPVENNSLTGIDIAKVKTNTDDNNIIQPAAYKELDTEDEKKSLYLGSIEINKDKFRGFFRKAGSIFRSKARQQEDDKSEGGPSNTRSLK